MTTNKTHRTFMNPLEACVEALLPLTPSIESNIVKKVSAVYYISHLDRIPIGKFLRRTKRQS